MTMSDSAANRIRGGLSEIATSIRVFGYCIVASTVIPAALFVTYLNGNHQ